MTPRPPGVPPGSGQDGVPTLLQRTSRGRRAIMRRRAVVALAAIATLAYIATHPPLGFGGSTATPTHSHAPSPKPGPSTAADVTPTARFEPAGATPTIDWGSVSYPVPDGGVGAIQLNGGVGTLAGQPVTLSQTIPVSFHQDPAEIVVLTTTGSGAAAAPTQFVYVYDLRDGTPAALSAASIPLSRPGARALWRLADGLLVRDETPAGGGSGGRSIQYAPTGAGTLLPAAP